MKICKYKITVLFSLISFVIVGQTFDKKISEKFKVNNNVELVINTRYTDVEITTWNRNEVAVEATIEVEGVSEEEAKKIINNWNFEALGNKSKVKVTSLGQQINEGFVFEFPDMDIEIPEFEVPEVEFEFPEMNIEIPEFNMPEIEIREFDYEAYKNDSTYLKKYKIEMAEELEKFRNSGWKKQLDSIRNSEEYRRTKEEFKRNKEVYKKQFLELNKELLENEKLIEETTNMALKIVEEMQQNGTLNEAVENYSEHIYFDKDASKNKKVRIRKEIHIKVPKNATFNLNVRHGKLDVPKSTKKMAATVSYGNFIGGNISGIKNKLTISNSPVSITSLNDATISLKNVPNAKFGTLNNVNCLANYADVAIENVEKNNSLSNKFGSLVLSNVSKDFSTLNIILDYAEATLHLNGAPFVYQMNSKKSKLDLPINLTSERNIKNNDVRIIEGFNNDKMSENKLILTSVYSTVLMN